MELIFISAIGAALTLAAEISELVQTRSGRPLQGRPGRTSQATRWIGSVSDCDTVTVQAMVTS